MDIVEICNLALSRIGMVTINGIDEASEAARLCNQFYDVTRKVVLRRSAWPFATRRIQLARIDVQPKDYLYAYRYPNNCVCLRKLYTENYRRLPDFNHYKVLSDTAGRILYTDIENAWMEYTADIKDCTLFDDEFVQALSWKLAAEIAFKLTGNASIMTSCLQAYNAYFTEAVADASNEQNELNPVLDSLAIARFRG